MVKKLQKHKNIIKKEKAITLITLVITIILLIILAGVAINVALGQNGLFTRAKEAKLSMQEANVKEIIENIILQMQIDEIEKRQNLTLKQVAENLKIKDGNITLEEYIEGEKELKGTYNLNGEEYKFTINEKLEVEIITNPYNIPTISKPNNKSEIREGNELQFSWEQLSEISRIIENTLKDDNINNDITNDTNEFTLKYEGKDYKIGVGDWKTVTYEENEYIVRIIGFNHDIKAGQNILKEDGTLKNEYKDTSNSDNQISEEGYSSLNKAGISFEFEECIMKHNMYDKNNTTGNGKSAGGWENRILRTILNGEGEEETRTNGTIDSLEEIKPYIKKVIKAYGKSYNNSTLSYTEDKIWILSCAETWGTSAYNSNCVSGMSKSMEGRQYKYYKNIKPIAGSNNTISKKTNGKLSAWWNRSLYYNNDYNFCDISSNGHCDYNFPSVTDGVSPCFSI